jgi:glycosyltransferase involved in cell wall biosynthesis
LARTFGIITTCMGRLDHLKQSLPKMVAQGCHQVIVVDYSCPQHSGEYVRNNFPSVRVVSVAGQEHFSNWRARNAGASVATADVLVFVDADIILADGAIEWLDEHLAEGAHGLVERPDMQRFNQRKLAVGGNQLGGFDVIPAAEFRRVGGYDEVFQGYASGADVDLKLRLPLAGLATFAIEPSIIERVIEHDFESRLQHHRVPLRLSYATGLLYCTAKITLLKLKGEVELELSQRRRLYAAARRAALALRSHQNVLSLDVLLDRYPVMMPRLLGHERGSHTVSLRIEVALDGKLEQAR